MAWKKRPTSFLGLRSSRCLPLSCAPLVRLYFNRILKKGVFPNGWKAAKARDPASGPATLAEARVRLEGAFARFDQECRRRAASGQHIVSTGFGTVSVEDFVRFDAMHTRHHCKQMPAQPKDGPVPPCSGRCWYRGRGGRFAAKH